MTVLIKNLAQKVDFLAKCRSNQDCRSICAGTVFDDFVKITKKYRNKTDQNEYTVARLWLVLGTGIQFMKMGIFGSQYFKFFLPR